MIQLYHFVKAGHANIRRGKLVPDTSGFFKDLGSDDSRVKKVYGNRLFIETIPKEYLDAWRNSGQLGSYLDAIVAMNWQERSVQRWRINLKKSDLSKALVRETYPISPEALGCQDYKADKEVYRRACLEMINSVVPFPEFTGQFKNPQVLIPSSVPKKLLRMDKLILWATEA